jgi:hypothetical protein
MIRQCATETTPNTSIKTPPAHQSDTSFFGRSYCYFAVVLRGGSPSSHNRFARHEDLFDFLKRPMLDPQVSKQRRVLG